MTFISRVLGFVRDMVVARIFGADSASDAFFVAFKIPNFLRRLFAEGAFSQAFVPVFAEYKEKRSDEELKALVDRVAGVFSVVLFGITLVGVIASPIIILIFGPGFADEPEKYQLASDMLKITFPYLFFIALTAFAGGVLNSIGRFWVPAFTPVFLNLCMIWAALYLSPQLETPITGLAWGVFLAGAVQLVFQAPFLWKEGLLPRPRWDWYHAGVQKIMKLMLPAIFGSSVVQINLLFDTLVASFLVTGSISWLYYSDRLVEFPLGVFGMALATVILPKLSRDHANASPEKFSATLDWGLRLTWVVGVPAAVGLATLGVPLLMTLFYGGKFGVHDVMMSSMSLTAYSIGLLGFILVKVLAPGFYARQNTSTPVKVGMVAIGVNIVSNICITIPWHLSGTEGAHMGLAISTSLSAFVNSGLLFYLLRKHKIYAPQAGWLLLFVRVAIASTAMAAMILYFSPELDVWTQWARWERALYVGLLVVAGMVSYFVALILMGQKIKPLLRLTS